MSTNSTLALRTRRPGFGAWRFQGFPNADWRCFFCGRRFTNESALMRHTRAQHSNSLTSSSAPARP